MEQMMACLMKVMQQKTDANLKEIKEEIRTNQARAEANHEKMMAKLDAHHEIILACLGKTEAMDLEANPEEMQFVVEHWEVPKEHATVKSVGGPRKRHGRRNLASGHCRKPKEPTWGNCGSQKKLAAASRKMTRHAGVPWRKVRVVRKNQTRDKVSRRTPKGWTFGKKCRLKPESIKGMRTQGLKKQLYLRTERTSGKIFGKTSGLEIAKQAAGSSVGCQNQGLDIVEGSAPSEKKESLLAALV
jgi:hypothetical protein